MDGSRGVDMLRYKAKPVIMLVEDNAQLRQSLQDILEIAGDYEVISVRDGLEGLNILHWPTTHPSLIVSDINMDRMDGYEFLQAVRNRKEWATIPFIFISSTREPGVKPYLGYLGVTAYLNKPFESRRFLSAVETALTATPDCTLV